VIDYVDMYDELDEGKSDLEYNCRNIGGFLDSYPKLKAAHEIIEDVIGDIRRRMEELEPLVTDQERRESEAQYRDYLRGIGPL
jgi:uncharacterized protein YPO0396